MPAPPEKSCWHGQRFQRSKSPCLDSKFHTFCIWGHFFLLAAESRRRFDTSARRCPARLINDLPKTRFGAGLHAQDHRMTFVCTRQTPSNYMTLRYITLYYILLHYIILHYITLHFVMYYIMFYFLHQVRLDQIRIGLD